MATINLGAIKFNWKGAYNSGTSYAVDDVVSSGGNSYVCIQAHSTAQAVGNATAYWNIMSSAGTNGTNGTDLTSTLTAQGDIVYRDGSGLAKLGAGTSGQYLETKGTGQNPVWSTVSAGNYSVHAFDKYSYNTDVAHNGQTHYLDIAGGNTVNFTPTHVNDVILFNQAVAVNTGNTQGFGIGLMMKAGSSSIGSGDTILKYTGSHAYYHNQLSDFYIIATLPHQLICTGLTVGTTYFVEQFGAVHTSNQQVGFNANPTNSSGDQYRHWVSLTHFKYNA